MESDLRFRSDGIASLCVPEPGDGAAGILGGYGADVLGI